MSDVVFVDCPICGGTGVETVYSSIPVPMGTNRNGIQYSFQFMPFEQACRRCSNGQKHDTDKE